MAHNKLIYAITKISINALNLIIKKHDIDIRNYANAKQLSW